MAKNTFVLCLFGLAGGLISSMAYPDNAIWIAIFPSTALMIYALVSGTFKQTFAVGLVTGFTFYASQIPWMTVYLGPVPWLALSTLEAIIFTLGALAINSFWHRTQVLRKPSHFLVAGGVASLWVAREWVACNFPYGGFPWSRLALSQSNSPLDDWVYWGGISALSFVIVFVTVLVITTWANQLRPENWGSSPVALVLALLVLVPQLTPSTSTKSTERLDVAAVQGNANAGLFANPVPGSILKNHLEASKSLLTASEKPDVVIWPENAADENPLAGGKAKALVADFAREVEAPLIFGTITSRGSDIYNSSVLWIPNLGAVDWYDKKRPVAFGEFVPDRQFFRLLAPELIDLIPRGYSFGTRDGIFKISSRSGENVKLGTMICFEVAVDDITRDLINQGAKVLVVQTNNSDFGTTNESAQQLAIAKLRAIESGRAVVNISTVGLSAIVLPNGEVIDALKPYQPGVIREKLQLHSEFTPAMQFGGYAELANNFAAIAIVFWMLSRRKARRGQ